jgi:hypothetical protein
MTGAAAVTATFVANLSLIQDTRTIAIPNPGVYPAKGVAQKDPVTGFTVTRLADKAELVGDYGSYKSALSTIVYSRYTPSNTTGEFVLVHGDNSTSAWVYRVSDNKLMTVLKIKPTVTPQSSVRSLGEVNELRWDYSGANPYRLYFVGRSIPASQAVAGEKPGMTFYYTDINPTTGAQSTPVVIKDFSKTFPSFTTGEIMNDVEGDSSNDSRYWAWQVMDTSRWCRLPAFGHLQLRQASQCGAGQHSALLHRCRGPLHGDQHTRNGCSVHQPPQHGGDVAQRHPCGRAL